MVAEIFILWCKSHVRHLVKESTASHFHPPQHRSRNQMLVCVSLQNFKREEQNFVVQNEINNLSFLTGDSKTKLAKVRVRTSSGYPRDINTYTSIRMIQLHLDRYSYPKQLYFYCICQKSIRFDGSFDR